MGNTAHIYLAGQTSVTLNVQGVFNSDSNKSDAEFTSALGNELVVTASPTAAAVIGDDAHMVNGLVEGYQPRSPGNDAVRFSMTMQGTAVGAGGKILHHNNQESGTGDHTSVRAVAQAASASGGVGHLHVTEFSGTDATITIEDSSDDIAFGSLVAFTQVTGLTSEKVEVPTGEVLEYVHVALTGTFSTITFVVGFARFLP